MKVSNKRVKRCWLLIALFSSALFTIQTAFSDEVVIEGEYRHSNPEDLKPQAKSLALPFDEQFNHELQFGALTQDEQLRIANLPQVGAMPIGIHREPTEKQRADLAKHIDWQLVERGWVGTVTVSSPGATSIRLQLEVQTSGPIEIAFFEFNQIGEVVVIDTFDKNHQASADTELTRHAPRIASETIWSPSATGNVIGLSILVPDKHTRDNTSVSIKKLAHRFATTFPLYQNHYERPTLDVIQPQDLSSCNSEHVTCHSGSVDTDAINATARINYEKNSTTWYCTGTLVNDTVPGTQHFMITAYHCIDSNSVAATVEADWFLQTSSCLSLTIDSRYRRTTGGADLVATVASADTSLIKLKTAPPSGTHYAGISTSNSNVEKGSILESYHHARAQHKKYARMKVLGLFSFNICDSQDQNCTVVRERIAGDFQVGVTEGGSSGSGWFKGNKLVAVHEGSTTQDSCSRHPFGNTMSKSYPTFSSHLTSTTPPPPTPVVSFGSSTSSAAENSGTVSLTVNASPAPSSSVTIDFTVGGTAQFSDFSTPSNTRKLTLAANATSSDISVAIANDSLHESDETVILTLVDGTDYDIGSASKHTLTITDDDTAPTAVSLSVSPQTLAENSGATNITATATVVGTSRWEGPQSISVSVDGSGSGNTVNFSQVRDFTLIIPSGAASGTATFSLTPTNDNVDTADANITVSGTLSNITINSASLTITDDDTAPTTASLSATPATVSEGAGATAVTVTATVGGTTRWGTAQTVSIAVADSSQSNVVSFTPVSSFNLTIPAAANSGSGTFSLSPIEDNVETNDETISVSGSLAGVAISVATITLTDNDQDPNVPVLTLTGGGVIEEGESASFTVRASPSPPSSITANLLIGNAPNSNFLSSSASGSSTLDVPTSGVATLSVSVPNDSADEANGAIVVSLNRGQGYAVGVTNVASVNVLDNDATSVSLTRNSTSGISENGGSANFIVSLGRNLRTGETVTAPLAITGDNIASDDYRLALNSRSGLNAGVTLNTSTPHSSAQPAVVFTGHDLSAVRNANLTLTAIDNSGAEPDTETINIGFGSGSRAVTSNLDIASGTSSGGTSASGGISIDILSGGGSSDPPPDPEPDPEPPNNPPAPPPISPPSDDHEDTPDKATMVDANSETNGRIESRGDVDFFQFSLYERGEISIKTLGAMDTICALTDENGTIARNDDDGPGRNCLIQTMQSEGTYWVSVEGYTDSTGNYTLSISTISEDVSDHEDMPHEVMVNTTLQTRLGHADDLDYFTVSADSAGLLVIHSRGNTDTIGCIFDESINDKETWHCDDDSGEGRNFRLEIEVDAPKDYLFRVQGHKGAIGDYELAIVFSKLNDEDNPFNKAALVASSADNWAYQIPRMLTREVTHIYRIEISHENQLSIQTEGAVDMQASLFRAPQFEIPISTGSNGGEGLNVKLATQVTPGTYYLELEGATSGDYGEYQLHLVLEDSFGLISMNDREH